MTQSQLNFNLFMNQLQFDKSFNFWVVQLFPSYWAHLLKFKLAKIIPCPIEHSPF